MLIDWHVFVYLCLLFSQSLFSGRYPTVAVVVPQKYARTCATQLLTALKTYAAHPGGASSTSPATRSRNRNTTSRARDQRCWRVYRRSCGLRWQDAFKPLTRTTRTRTAPSRGKRMSRRMTDLQYRCAILRHHHTLTSINHSGCF